MDFMQNAAKLISCNFRRQVQDIKLFLGQYGVSPQVHCVSKKMPRGLKCKEDVMIGHECTEPLFKEGMVALFVDDDIREHGKVRKAIEKSFHSPPAFHHVLFTRGV